MKKPGTFLTCLAVLTAFGMLYHTDLPHTSFHSDEMLWPCMGRLYTYVVRGDWGSAFGKQTRFESANGPIVRYLYGWWGSRNDRQIQAFQEACNATLHEYVPKTMHDLTPSDIRFLFVMRSMGLVVSLAVLFVAFLLFLLVFGLPWAVVGSVIIGLNPLFRVHAVRSMAEMPLLLFITAALVFAWILMRRLYMRKRSAPIAIMYGVFCGLSVMTKPYGIMAFAPWILLIVFLPVAFIQKMFHTIVIVVSALITICIAYPPFLLNPFSIYTWFMDVINLQNWFQEQFPDVVLHTPAEKLQTIVRYYFIPRRGSIFPAAAFISGAIFVLGMGFLFWRIIRKRNNMKREYFIVSVAIGFVCCGMVYLYRSWERYFLPFIIPITLVQLYALHLIAQTARSAMEWMERRKISNGGYS